METNFKKINKRILALKNCSIIYTTIVQSLLLLHVIAIVIIIFVHTSSDTASWRDLKLARGPRIRSGGKKSGLSMSLNPRRGGRMDIARKSQKKS